MVLHDEPMSASSNAYNLMPTLSATEILNAEPQIYQNDNLDDVFGSAPPSPLHHGDDDEGFLLFADGSRRDRADRSRGRMDEVSDIPRLREKHETEGYRDGVTRGKATTVQQGFDEGYTLGAVLGLRVGRVLGLLEGIAAAIAVGDSVMDGGAGEKKANGERGRVDGLLRTAKDELKLEDVFGREWWGEDGIWKFEVPGEGEGMDVVFTDVADAHPLIKKWEGLIDEEANRWGLDLRIMEREREHEEEEGKVAAGTQVGKASAKSGAAKELSW